MYKIFFKNKDLDPFLEVARASSIEDALALAVGLHRSSNVPHFVTVENLQDDKEVVTLKRGE